MRTNYLKYMVRGHYGTNIECAYQLLGNYGTLTKNSFCDESQVTYKNLIGFTLIFFFTTRCTLITQTKISFVRCYFFTFEKGKYAPSFLRTRQMSILIHNFIFYFDTSGSI